MGTNFSFETKDLIMWPKRKRNGHSSCKPSASISTLTTYTFTSSQQTAPDTARSRLYSPSPLGTVMENDMYSHRSMVNDHMHSNRSMVNDTHSYRSMANDMHSNRPMVNDSHSYMPRTIRTAVG